MSTRRINFCLQLMTAALASAAVIVVVAGFMIPVENASAPTIVPRPMAATTEPMSSVSAESFAAIYGRSFQASAIAPAAAPSEVAIKASQAPPASTVPAAGLTLVGTVGDSLALIQGPNGAVAMFELGDDYQGAVVIAIRPSEVDIRQNGKVVTLRKAAPPDDRELISAHGSQPQ